MIGFSAKSKLISNKINVFFILTLSLPPPEFLEPGLIKLLAQPLLLESASEAVVNCKMIFDSMIDSLPPRYERSIACRIPDKDEGKTNVSPPSAEQLRKTRSKRRLPLQYIKAGRQRSYLLWKLQQH